MHNQYIKKIRIKDKYDNTVTNNNTQQCLKQEEVLGPQRS